MEETMMYIVPHLGAARLAARLHQLPHKPGRGSLFALGRAGTRGHLKWCPAAQQQPARPRTSTTYRANLCRKAALSVSLKCESQGLTSSLELPAQQAGSTSCRTNLFAETLAADNPS